MRAAFGHYQHAVELGTQDIETRTRMATLLCRRGDFEGADNLIQKFEEQYDATTSEMSRLASRISFKRNDFDRALRMAKISVEQSATPRQADILFLARMYAVDGQLDAARASCEQAIRLAPTDELPHLALVQLLVAASRQSEAAGRTEDSGKFLADAEKAAADAEQQVEANQRARTAAHCLDFLGKPDRAAQMFEQAINESPQNPQLLETAARFYVKHPQFRAKAQPILEQFVAGQLPQDPQVLSWRARAGTDVGHVRGYQGFLAAMKLVDANLQAEPDSAADLELRARLLSARLLPSLKREAVKSLERLVDLPQPVAPDTAFFLAQLYDSQGRWVNASRLMTTTIVDVSRTDPRGRYLVYLNVYVRALLHHGDISEAKIWTAKLKRVAPRPWAPHCSRREPCRPPQSRGQMSWPASTMSRKLYRSSSLPSTTRKCTRTTSRNANESADAYAQRDRDAKKSVVVAVLADLLQEVTTFGTPDDAKLLRATLDQYYAEWNADNPGHELEQVPYLVRTGRRKQAVELTTRQEYWQVASVTTLATACGAVLADLEKRLLVPDARAAGTSGSKDAVAASDTDEVKLQAAAMEEVLQNVLGKCRSEYASAPPRDQVDKSNAVAAILSLLANHFFNTGHVDPQRYQRAADLYTEILTLQPINVEAIRNRAALFGRQR